MPREPENECDLPEQIALFASHRICPLRIMCIASYPPIVFSAPLTDRNQRPARDSLLDESVVLFHDIVHVLRRTATALLCQFAGLHQFGNRTGVRRMSVHINYSGSRLGDSMKSMVSPAESTTRYR
jgi:hypothetical protein